MAETAGARLRDQAGMGIVRYVLDHFVEVAKGRYRAAVDQTAHLPRNYVIGAGRVSRDADGPGLVSVVVESQAASKYIHSADAHPDQRIVLGPKPAGVALVGLQSVHGIALLQAEQASPRLHG